MQKLHQTLESIMKRYATEPVKVHLNKDMKTTRNHAIIKNKTDIELSKEYWICQYLSFMFERKTFYH